MMVRTQYRGFGLEIFDNAVATVVRWGREYGKGLTVKEAHMLIDRAQARITIPNGSLVYFLRREISFEPYKAKVVSSYLLAGKVGHRYILDCPDYPYIVGFAEDHELFTNIHDANVISQEVKLASHAKRRELLLSRRDTIDAELRALETH